MRKKFLCLLLMTLCITGCGSTSSSSIESASLGNSKVANFDSYSYDVDSASYETEISDENANETNLNETERKLVKTVSISMETKDFDSTISFINSKTDELKGYVAQSDISDNGYDEYSSRYANFDVKIPEQSSDEFITGLKENGNLTNTTESVQDITLTYVDTESHIEALSTEYHKLLDLMESAETMEDTITIQKRLSEINYEKANYESQLRVYDNQVDYTEISIYVREVDRESLVGKVGFGTEVADRFITNVNEIKEGVREFLVTVIGGIPYIVLYGAVIALIVYIIKTIDKVVCKKKKVSPINTEKNE